jgi:hypothetical protein
LTVACLRGIIRIEEQTKMARKDTEITVVNDPFSSPNEEAVVPVTTVGSLPADWATLPRLADIIPDAPVMKAADMAGRPFVIDGWRQLDGDTGPYAAMHAYLPDGSECFVTCGGMGVIEKLKSFDVLVEKGLHKYPIVITLESVPLPGGKTFWRVI